MRRRVLTYLKGEGRRTGSAEAIARALLLSGEERAELPSLLRDMQAEGEVLEDEPGVFVAPETVGLVLGRMQASAKGFGFVVPDEREAEDVYVPAEGMAGAMHGDRVLVRVVGPGRDGGHPDGVVERIVRRARESLVGNLERRAEGLCVVPDERRIAYEVWVEPDAALGAEEGEKVVVAITTWPDGQVPCRGRVVARLGRVGEPGVDVLGIVHRYELPTSFPDDVVDEAEAIEERVRPEEIAGRWDLRDLTTVTIDSEESRDLDDAVSLERLADGGYRLGVHIADVSHYVREGTALDREALERGTSVYLVDRVIPMLPERLSNGICSLNPRVERLTMSVFIDFDPAGNRRRYEIGRSVIRTAERMTYKAVNAVLAGDGEARRRYAPLVATFEAMRELMERLRARRDRRGAIDFEPSDEKVVLDSEGRPVEIVRRERTVADQIVEEFMLAANEAVAEHFARQKVPFLYRVHDEPDPDRIEALGEFLAHLGYTLPKADTLHPRMLQAVLQRVAGRPEEHLVSAVTLRALKRARYAAECRGHFGLAAVYYTHFTSPIRRYPDLMIHRIIGESLAGTLTAERRAHYEAILPAVAEQSTQRERRAEDAERESVDLKKVEYMAAHVGEEFTGLVSGVTSFGLFVELENTCEGLVHVSSFLDDYYQYHESRYALVGERTGRMFRLADPVKVRVMRVDPSRNQVELALSDFAEAVRRRQAISAGPRGASRPYSGPPRTAGGTPKGGAR
ncbi:MAG: ribonuclease R [Firmicutes bacterium]|nr:ribonuclease R [Bacillota bacterium]